MNIEKSKQLRHDTQSMLCLKIFGELWNQKLKNF